MARLSAGGGERPLSERTRGFSGKNSVRPAHPGACRGVDSTLVFLPRGAALNPSGNLPPDPSFFFLFFRPHQLAWIIFSLIIAVSSSHSDPTPASRPSLLHWIYGVALKRKQAWGGGRLPSQNPYEANLNSKKRFFFFCSAVTPALAGERLLPVLPRIPKVPPQPLLLPGCSGGNGG